MPSLKSVAHSLAHHFASTLCRRVIVDRPRFFFTNLNKLIEFISILKTTNLGVFIMTNTENLVLEHLKHIRGKVDIISEDMKGLKYRMNSIENAVGGLKRDTANTQDDVYHQTL
jgi:hypothetical protein